MSFINPYRFAGAGGGVTYITSDSDNYDANNSTTSTFTLSLGADQDDRVVVALIGHSKANVRNVSTVKFNDISATGIILNDTVDGGYTASICLAYWNDAALAGVGAGSYDMVVVHNGGTEPTIAQIVELSNVNQSTPFGTVIRDERTDQSGHVYTMNVTGESGEFILSGRVAGDDSTIDAGITAPANVDTKLFDEYYSTGGEHVAVALGYTESCADSDETFGWTELESNTIDSLQGFAVPVYAA